MPLYEYLCRDCGAKFEALLSISKAEQIVQCSRCESQNTTRLLSVFNAHSSGKVIAGSNTGSSCSGCAGGNCSTCGH